MAYSKELAERIRKALSNVPEVEEKKMFGKLAFMVNGKMCLSAGFDSIMCRIDPAIHEEVIGNQGVETVIMKGKKYKGYVYVNQEQLKNLADFNYWVAEALDFNKKLSQN